MRNDRARERRVPPDALGDQINRRNVLKAAAAVSLSASLAVHLADGVVVADSDGIIYAIRPDGELLWYRHEGRDDGSAEWTEDVGRAVGTGWGDFQQVFPGGDGVIYAIRNDGGLLWYRHEGRDDGSAEWTEGTGRSIGTGWGDFQQVF
jgi:hypothetical protein